MKRLFQIGIASLLTATTVMLMPWAAIAQSPRLLEELDLTDTQKEELRDIFATRRAEINEIVTDAQRQQFREAYQESQNFLDAVAAIENLTEDQRSEIRTVVQASRQDIREILTEEQLAELRSFIQEQYENRL